MNHKRSSHVHNRLNGALGFGVLVLGANTAEGLGLTSLLACFLEHFCSKDTIIAVVVLDTRCSLLPEPLFETQFGHNGLAGAQRDLVFDMYDLGRSISKYSTAMEHVLFLLATISSKQSTGLSDNILVH